ncbi:hypothetical protein EYC84_012121 [Monilinia fructicola]|uniref:Uncharacterized protein n=1 Tax=Monilinia fructicola TaxID=38448 RepID=A0A5M9J4J1_MONFR|nr:hypothetical protein EYC84_012121 [Monilinia fructicola]
MTKFRPPYDFKICELSNIFHCFKHNKLSSAYQHVSCFVIIIDFVNWRGLHKRVHLSSLPQEGQCIYRWERYWTDVKVI